MITKGVGGEPSEPALQYGLNLAKKEMIRSLIRLMYMCHQSVQLVERSASQYYNYNVSQFIFIKNKKIQAIIPNLGILEGGGILALFNSGWCAEPTPNTISIINHPSFNKYEFLTEQRMLN